MASFYRDIFLNFLNQIQVLRFGFKGQLPLFSAISNVISELLVIKDQTDEKSWPLLLGLESEFRRWIQLPEAPKEGYSL